MYGEFVITTNQQAQHSKQYHGTRVPSDMDAVLHVVADLEDHIFCKKYEMNT
jgi:hypothetical protein